jgi:hypothetical protein
MAMSAQVLPPDTETAVEAQRCSAIPCDGEVSAELESRPLCVEHFVSVSMRELDTRSQRVKDEAYDSSETTAFRGLLSSCAQQAQRLAEDKRNSDSRTKTRLLDVLLRVSQLSQSLRRSPRVDSAVSVYVRREDPGRVWEEETWTSTISRHGAGMVCRHLVEKGGVVVVCRKDRGERALARVVYCHYDAQGRRQIGVEFLDRPDFWDFSKQARASDPV